MTQPDARLLIIVPTRSRPENVAKVVQAWEDTDGFRHADLCFAHDKDDPKFMEYCDALLRHEGGRFGDSIFFAWMPEWKPLVPKLDAVARRYAERKHRSHFAIGFAGDDHLPRTHGWVSRYLETLLEMGTGVVSCPDGYRTDDLPTQWAMTADIVRALGRMVPAPVAHLYCDDAVRDLAKAAGCWRFLDDVLIEHVHPLSKTSGASWDDQYRHVNRPEQYERDSAAYAKWFDEERLSDVTKVRALIEASR